METVLLLRNKTIKADLPPPPAPSQGELSPEVLPLNGAGVGALPAAWGFKHAHPDNDTKWAPKKSCSHTWHGEEDKMWDGVVKFHDESDKRRLPVRNEWVVRLWASQKENVPSSVIKENSCSKLLKCRQSQTQSGSAQERWA